MKKGILICFFISFLSVISAQKLVRIGTLPESISESSGLVFYNDTLLITHNDSGDKPMLYFINLKGKLVGQVLVENATNTDWEDLCRDDKGNLYIADIGNNNNDRRDLKIYKVNMRQLFGKEKVSAEVITFSYQDQKAFPPSDSLLNFDSEGLAFQNDSLLLFTKCRATPFHGYTFCYKLPTSTGKHIARKSFELFIGTKGFLKDAVTAATICDNRLYLLTYNRFLIYNYQEGKWVFQEQHFTQPYSQKEAIITKDNRTFYLTDEVQKILGGGKLYKMELK